MEEIAEEATHQRLKLPAALDAVVTTLTGLMENEEYNTALAMVRSLPIPTQEHFKRRLNKIEANILLASTLGSPADFQSILVPRRSTLTFDASPTSGDEDDHIPIGLCAKVITPGLSSIPIGCLDISGNDGEKRKALHDAAACVPL